MSIVNNLTQTDVIIMRFSLYIQVAVGFHTDREAKKKTCLLLKIMFIQTSLPTVCFFVVNQWII